MNISYMEPILALRMKFYEEEWGLVEQDSGFVFFAFTGPYIFACPMTMVALERLEKRVVMIVAIILFSIGSLLLGPN